LGKRAQARAFGISQAMFDVGYFPPNTPPGE
jgi:hypothetical protein